MAPSDRLLLATVERRIQASLDAPLADHNIADIRTTLENAAVCLQEYLNDNDRVATLTVPKDDAGHHAHPIPSNALMDVDATARDSLDNALVHADISTALVVNESSAGKQWQSPPDLPCDAVPVDEPQIDAGVLVPSDNTDDLVAVKRFFKTMPTIDGEVQQHGFPQKIESVPNGPCDHQNATELAAQQQSYSASTTKTSDPCWRPRSSRHPSTRPDVDDAAALPLRIYTRITPVSTDAVQAATGVTLAPHTVTATASLVDTQAIRDEEPGDNSREYLLEIDSVPGNFKHNGGCRHHKGNFCQSFSNQNRLGSHQQHHALHPGRLKPLVSRVLWIVERQGWCCTVTPTWLATAMNQPNDVVTTVENTATDESHSIWCPLSAPDANGGVSVSTIPELPV